MSSKEVQRIRCPKCGAEHDFAIWTRINTDLDPDLDKKVRSGELFRTVCPSCGQQIDVVYPCLYHQMKNKVMIYYAPGREAMAKAAEAFGPVKDELFIDVPFSALDDGEGYEPKLDDYVELDMDENEDGPLGGIIVDISDDTVLVDCNHPMAGKTLNFSGKVIEVRDATEKELDEGLHGEYLPTEEGGKRCRKHGGKCHKDEGEGCCKEEGDGECCHSEGKDGEGCCNGGGCSEEKE
jgi:FKBP-type peptidyl-prolyl cis-trans isomerase 2